MANAVDEVRGSFETMYRDFNLRNIDAVLARMTDDVEWPNGWEGGYVKGHDQVRDYWARQWAELDPTVDPVRFSSRADGRVDVEVHQVVRSLAGAVMADQTVHHIYRLRDGYVAHMEISA